ncbi:MAG: SDR family oxidoreductase [Clostridiales bacterium]|nr:SDR family oxidoreductase [Clostridiales bacterium]
MISSMKNAFSVSGKNILITGGTQGLGKGMADAFLEVGANVGFTGRDKEKAAKVIEEMNAKYPGCTARYYQVDHRKQADCQRSVDSFMKDFGKIDTLINNAGAGRGGPAIDFIDNDFADWHYTLELDLTAVFMMSTMAAKYMKDTGGGSIINITSNAGFVVNKPQKIVAYATAKAGANHMTKMLAHEWAPYKIRVNAIAPGYFESDLTPPELADLMKLWIEYTPTGRQGLPIELGALAVYLASDSSEQMTGAILCIDGGYSLAN